MASVKPTERPSRIDLIAFDLDGTILEAGEVIPPAAKRTLAEIVKRGLKIATATGRSLEDQVRILKRNGLGSSCGFPHSLIADEWEIYFLTGSGYKPYTQHNNMMRRAWAKVLPEVKKIVQIELQRLSTAGVSVRREVNDDEAARRGTIDLTFEKVDDAKAEENFLRTVRLCPAELFIHTRNYRHVIFIHSRAGKGNTLKVLAEYWNIAPSKILCIGDSSNDLSMLDGRHGFLAATISNADEEVKKAVYTCGGYIASKPYSKGVVEILQKFVLS